MYSKIISSSTKPNSMNCNLTLLVLAIEHVKNDLKVKCVTLQGENRILCVDQSCVNEWLKQGLIEGEIYKFSNVKYNNQKNNGFVNINYNTTVGKRMKYDKQNLNKIMFSCTIKCNSKF